MIVDPLQRTHLTIKFWGGALAGVPQVQRDTWLLDPALNYSKQYGSSHNFPCELDQVDPVSGVAMWGLWGRQAVCHVCATARVDVAA